MEKSKLKYESKEALNGDLQEYEAHTKTIENQLATCKKDHIRLQAKIEQLVKENNDLSHQLKLNIGDPISMREKLDLGDNSLIESLQQQLSSISEEKETIEKLWKSSVKEADNLREKLRECQSGKQLTILQCQFNDSKKDYTEAIRLLESRLAAVKKDNDQLSAKNKLLEGQLSQVTSQMSIISEQNLVLKNSLNEVTSKEQEWKSQYLNIESKFIKLEQAYQADKVKFANIYEFEKVEANLKGKLEIALRQRDELQSALEQCHNRMAEMMSNATSDRGRIEEAVTLVEGAIQNRDEALQRETLCLEDSKKMRTELLSQLEEARQLMIDERTALQKQFDNQLTGLKDQLHVFEQERIRNNIEVDQLQKECNRLQLLLDKEQKQPTPDNRDRHLERVYHDLRSSEVDVEQLQMENKTLHAVVSKLQDKCQKNHKEKEKLRHQLMRSEQQCQSDQLELEVINQRADLLNSEVNQLKLELAQNQSETYFIRTNTDNFQSKVALTNTLGQLYKEMDNSYSKMNDKWKKEMTDLTEKFESKLKQVKSKNKNGF